VLSSATSQLLPVDISPCPVIICHVTAVPCWY
jgi:hypothetical protein